VRLGLLGGTFNPIHLGHLRSAVEVRETFNLDRVLLIPSAHPPHRASKGIADAEDRLEMVRLAAQGVPCLEASDVELSRPGPSYTIETLELFQHRFGPRCDIHFIIGFDAFSEIATWKAFKKLFATARFVVTGRSGAHPRDLETVIHADVSPNYRYDTASRSFEHPEWLTIYSMEVTRFDISGTQVRRCLRKHRSITFLVPRAVEDYIYDRKLYLDGTNE
jgi:nicotinate-nucleotide adenylyltransferase